ncbi:hypothetical protein [Paenibacillus montanisoli]|uniref:DUF3828 domain-containing protein n=1 Tax=Paenibacillus montanisoli TaxID=2081970 RepID=A0A328UCC4_9BACL|nr:hypothetical protein [Paenibacillus montanisoli]RAP77676.1 hypothetical protein DL346_04185 [Paenibacillus montanisoli]
MTKRLAVLIMALAIAAAVPNQRALADPAPETVFIDESGYEGDLLACVKLINLHLNYLNAGDSAASKQILTSDYRATFSAFTPGYTVSDAKLRKVGKTESGGYVAYVDVDSKLKKKPMIETITYEFKRENDVWLIDKSGG